ncbi:DUF2188 domain-containing protein [Hymenobacter crusticola]|uniref:DUF2188 domain-containing protein n=1 Tax=Hymenobacter crusticola TaxID=1770526 RepID=A0A243W7B9_9BACT|nr:hypothetical protein BXP70_27145 [Hymenobacter crusticola]
MARTIYYVVYHNNQWKIKLGEQHYGPYTTQALAIRSAIDAAHQSGPAHNAQVLVQGTNNQFRTEYTYGADPYPPRG